MSVRELIALGTGSQVPSRYRNHNGYLLRWDDEGVLFDPGDMAIALVVSVVEVDAYIIAVRL